MDSAKVHVLKTDPASYADMVSDCKTHTTRFNDRGYAEGDYIISRETKYTGEQMAGKDSFPLVYTGRSTMCKITHVYSGPGTSGGWVVCSLKIIDRFPGRVG